MNLSPHKAQQPYTCAAQKTPIQEYSNKCTCILNNKCELGLSSDIGLREPWKMSVHKRGGVVYLDVHMPERPKSEMEHRR
jgi:hypothetical protein